MGAQEDYENARDELQRAYEWERNKLQYKYEQAKKKFEQWAKDQYKKKGSGKTFKL